MANLNHVMAMGLEAMKRAAGAQQTGVAGVLVERAEDVGPAPVDPLLLPVGVGNLENMGELDNVLHTVGRDAELAVYEVRLMLEFGRSTSFGGIADYTHHGYNCYVVFVGGSHGRNRAIEQIGMDAVLKALDAVVAQDASVEQPHGTDFDPTTLQAAVRFFGPNSPGLRNVGSAEGNGLDEG